MSLICNPLPACEWKKTVLKGDESKSVQQLELTENVSAWLSEEGCALGFLGNSGRLWLLPVSTTHTAPLKSPGTIQWEKLTQGGLGSRVPCRLWTEAVAFRRVKGKELWQGNLGS